MHAPCAHLRRLARCSMHTRDRNAGAGIAREWHAAQWLAFERPSLHAARVAHGNNLRAEQINATATTAAAMPARTSSSTNATLCTGQSQARVSVRARIATLHSCTSPRSYACELPMACPRQQHCIGTQRGAWSRDAVPASHHPALRPCTAARSPPGVPPYHPYHQPAAAANQAQSAKRP